MTLKKLLWIFFGGHSWKYRNPYDRTCQVCGKHEVSHCSDIENWSRAWWEIFAAGDETKHYLKD